MNILFTSASNKPLGGVQSVLRALAAALDRRGHRTAVFKGGASGSKADGALVTVPRLDDLPFKPDILHCNHHINAMPAIMTLTDVPAIYSCHGASRSERQPLHPRILRYTAMTTTLRMRIATESAIPEDDIAVVFNAIDLNRFRNVKSVPARPRNALVYQRNLRAHSAVGREIAIAADRAGIRVDFRGIGDGLDLVEEPWMKLPEYDLVFSSGISAIEAMASGCAVIVLQGNIACGEMVTPDNFERFRNANFSVPVNSPRPTVESIFASISQFDAAKVQETTRLLRAVADIDQQADRYCAIYEDVIAEYRRTGRDQAGEQRAAAQYLRELAPMIRFVDRDPDHYKQLNSTKDAIVSQFGSVMTQNFRG